MQMQKIDDAMQGVTRLGLDTSPVIYFVEANPVYDARVTDVFQRFGCGSFRKTRLPFISNKLVSCSCVLPEYAIWVTYELTRCDEKVEPR